MRPLLTLLLVVGIALPAHAQDDSGLLEDTDVITIDPGDGAAGLAGDAGGAPRCGCDVTATGALGWLALLGPLLIARRRR